MNDIAGNKYLKKYFSDIKLKQATMLYFKNFLIEVSYMYKVLLQHAAFFPDLKLTKAVLFHFLLLPKLKNRCWNITIWI